MRSPPTSSTLPPSAITIRHRDAIEDVGHSKDPQAAKPHRRGGLSCWVCWSCNCLPSPFRSRLAHPKLQPRKGNRPHVMHSLLSISCMQQPCALPSMSPPTQKKPPRLFQASELLFLLPFGLYGRVGGAEAGEDPCVCSAVRSWANSSSAVGLLVLFMHTGTHRRGVCVGGGGSRAVPPTEVNWRRAFIPK